VRWATPSPGPRATWGRISQARSSATTIRKPWRPPIAVSVHRQPRASAARRRGGDEAALEFTLEERVEVDLGEGGDGADGGAAGEDRLEEVDGAGAGDLGELALVLVGVEAAVAAALAGLGGAAAALHRVEGELHDGEELALAPELGEVAGAARDGVVDDEEALAGGAGGLRHGRDPEVGGLAAEFAAKAELEGGAEGADDLADLVIGDREEDPDRFGGVVAVEADVDEVLGGAGGAGAAPGEVLGARGAVVAILDAAAVGADAKAGLGDRFAGDGGGCADVVFAAEVDLAEQRPRQEFVAEDDLTLVDEPGLAALAALLDLDELDEGGSALGRARRCRRRCWPRAGWWSTRPCGTR
jgi:hypothetical protein